MRNGQGKFIPLNIKQRIISLGTLWIFEGKNKLKREYTGDWVFDRKTGRGTQFFKNEDRYDG